MSCNVQFVDERIKKAFEKLSNGKYEEKDLIKYLKCAFLDIEKNPFCGIQILKRLIPEDYLKKYNLKNLWKYNLPNAWRLLYSLESQKVVIVAIKFIPNY